MLIECDQSQLEWRCAVALSHDAVGIAEILNHDDIHLNNQKFFGLPERVIAKIFLFRAIYRGSAWSYAHDPDFMGVSTSERYWQKVIDAMYEKYSGLNTWHSNIIREANSTGQLTNITGRVYEFKKNKKDEYSVNDITNYNVQGLGSELMAVCRVSAYSRYKNFELKDRMKFVNTVHDSIVVDADVKEGSEELSKVCCFLEDVFSDSKQNFERLFKVPLDVPFAGECKFGNTWANMTKFKRGEI